MRDYTSIKIVFYASKHRGLVIFLHYCDGNEVDDRTLAVLPALFDLGLYLRDLRHELIRNPCEGTQWIVGHHR